MDFRYKSELNEFFIRRENLEEISRIKIDQENNENNPILTPILMKYGKIFYLVFQIQNRGIYGIEVNVTDLRTGIRDRFLIFGDFEKKFRYFLTTNMVPHSL